MTPEYDLTHCVTCAERTEDCICCELHPEDDEMSLSECMLWAAGGIALALVIIIGIMVLVLIALLIFAGIINVVEYLG